MARAPATRSQGLFPSEEEIARRLSQPAADRRAKSKILKRDGLPRIDPLMQGRYWPAVQAFFGKRHGLHKLEVSHPDGEENRDAL